MSLFRWKMPMAASNDSGPTEFVAESHRLGADSTMDAVETAASRMDDGPASATTNEDESPIVSPVLKRGDILIYDYRICHRGTANLTNALKKYRKEGRVRTILYLMYARPWFKEHMNFGTEKLFAEN
jgi:hypothetical protein